MHHQVAVGEVHRIADLAEQLQARVQAQAFFAREAEDVEAADVFHGHVGPAVGRQAAVDQAGDAGVFERGQDAAFVAEVGHRAGRLGPDQLQRHLLVEVGAVPVRQVDLAHAAAADQFFDAEVADQFVRIQRAVGHGRGFGFGRRRGGTLQEIGLLVQRLEHAPHALAGGLVHVGAAQGAFALVGVELVQFVEQGGDRRPLPGGVVTHGAGLPGRLRAERYPVCRRARARGGLARADQPQ